MMKKKQNYLKRSKNRWEGRREWEIEGKEYNVMEWNGIESN